VAEENGDPRGERWATVATAIRERRSNLNVDLERPVARELIDELIGLAVTAPNHYRTNPWRFVVLTGAARARVGEIAAQAVSQQPDAKESIVERQRTQFLRAPAVIVAAAAPDDDPIKHFENKHAVAAGVQNILLGATAAGLASAWRSGLAMVDPTVAEPVKEALGLAPDDEIVAFIYLGHPIGPPGSRDTPTAQVRHLDQ
jgi:nitroreductase